MTTNHFSFSLATYAIRRPSGLNRRLPSPIASYSELLFPSSTTNHFWLSMAAYARRSPCGLNRGPGLSIFICSLFCVCSVVLLPTLPYSVLGIANPTTEHQSLVQTRRLMSDFF